MQNFDAQIYPKQKSCLYVFEKVSHSFKFGPFAYSVEGFAAKEAFGILNDQIQICNHRFDMARAAGSSGITTVSKSAISTDSPAKHSVNLRQLI
jgi:hypothetical protein